MRFSRKILKLGRNEILRIRDTLKSMPRPVLSRRANYKRQACSVPSRRENIKLYVPSRVVAKKKRSTVSRPAENFYTHCPATSR